jgi:hypothetical protein
MPNTSAVEHAWGIQSVWSQVADRLKAGVERWRRVTLALQITGAMAATLGAVVGLETAGGKWLAFAAALAIALSAISGQRIGRTAVRDWIRARSGSEAIKSEVYLWLSGTTTDDEGAFQSRVDGLDSDVDDLRRYATGVGAKERPVPAVHDVPSYVEIRVSSQINGYYRERAERSRRSLGLARAAELVLAVAGAILAAAAGTWGLDGLAVWVPVATTLVTAVTAHAAAQRYEYLLVEYLRTAAALERLQLARGVAGELSDADFVRECERIISSQNEDWMAKLDDPEGASRRGTKGS